MVWLLAGAEHNTHMLPKVALSPGGVRYDPGKMTGNREDDREDDREQGR